MLVGLFNPLFVFVHRNLPVTHQASLNSPLSVNHCSCLSQRTIELLTYGMLDLCITCVCYHPLSLLANRDTDSRSHDPTAKASLACEEEVVTLDFTLAEEESVSE